MNIRFYTSQVLTEFSLSEKINGFDLLIKLWRGRFVKSVNSREWESSGGWLEIVDAVFLIFIIRCK